MAIDWTAEQEILFFGSEICKGCEGTGGLYTVPGSPAMKDTPDGYADNWRRCFYCDGTGTPKPEYSEVRQAEGGAK